MRSACFRGLIAIAAAAVILQLLPLASAQDMLSQRCQDAGAVRELGLKFRDAESRLHELSQRNLLQAKLLIADARKIADKTTPLKGNVRETGRAYKLDAKQHSIDLKAYSLKLQEFQKHSQLYNAHLADYEKQLQAAQAANKSLQASCSHYADHVQRFHVPGIRPPHVCVQMEWEQRATEGAAKRLLVDQKKTAEAEKLLAKQESSLQQAAQERLSLQKTLLEKANLDELEQTKGRLLLQEYEELEREYRFINLARMRSVYTPPRN